MRNRRKASYNPNKGFSKKVFGVLAAIIVILIGIKVIFSLNYEDFYKKYGLDKDDINLIYGSEVLGNKGIIQKDGEIYIPVNTIKETIDPYIYINDDNESITITTAEHVIKMNTDETTYYVNDEAMDLSLPLYTIDDTSYLPADIMEEIYDAKIVYNEESSILTMDGNKDSLVYANTVKKGKLYFENTENSRIIRKVKKDESLVLFNNEGDYTLVRTDEGYVGYIKTACLSETTASAEEETQPKVLWQPENGKINMVFDQVTSIAHSSNAERRTSVDGLDVISPTFFSFENTDGDIKNIADKGYVEWAHNEGYQVWALITDNFDGEISRSILTSDNTRSYVIKQLLAFCSMYDLDGINLDFESVPTDCSQQWVQFVRELTPMLHKEGIVVSVDCFVPKSWTEHYMRKEISEVVDYIVVMGYDEHYAGSTESGSVASISWSEEAITATLNEGVPKEKLILGIPFYTRVWTETADGGLNSQSYGMESAYEFMQSKNADIQWLENMGQYYGEAAEDDVVYKCWFEDERSTKLRVQLVTEYDVAGTAAWKKGLEYDQIWNVIKEGLKD